MGDGRLRSAKKTPVESFSRVSCGHGWTPHRMVIAVVYLMLSSDINQKSWVGMGTCILMV